MSKLVQITYANPFIGRIIIIFYHVLLEDPSMGEIQVVSANWGGARLVEKLATSADSNSSSKMPTSM